jgi:recombinational DNA repair protein (RecF pathway)
MKTLDQCLDESEDKLSRRIRGKADIKGTKVDTLYPILTMIVKDGVKVWLTQYLNERTRESERSEGAYLQLEEILKDLENNPSEVQIQSSKDQKESTK